MKYALYLYVIFASVLVLMLMTACGSPEHFQAQNQVIVKQPVDRGPSDLAPCPEEEPGSAIEVPEPTNWQDSNSSNDEQQKDKKEKKQKKDKPDHGKDK